MDRSLLLTLLAATTLTVALTISSPWTSSARAEEPDGEPLPAEAGDFTLSIEPGVSFPLSAPQSQLFDTGGSQTVKAFWALKPYLDLGPSATFLALPSSDGVSKAGTTWAFGGSLRLKRPHSAPDDDALHAISPWADIDALYVRTGALDRAGLAAAVGLAVPLGAARIFWIGPFIRYLHILQPERTNYDNSDGKILTVGISLDVGSGIRRTAPKVAPPVAEAIPVTKTVNRDVFVCPDRDNDDVPDKSDRCPDVAGAFDNWGCPPYKKLVVKKDKLELKEKLYFAWNQATLQEVSFPVMDEVVKALNDNKGLQVQVEGHTSSEGADDHNQTLSEKRAQAVLDYLVAHGIDKSRLSSKGLASAVPIDTNATVSGRENNRRVEFVVHFTIVNDGSK